MTDQIASDNEPTSLPMALIELRHARSEIARLTPFVAVADGASRAAEHWEAEAKRFKEDYLKACGTIAEMHSAAVGRSDRGPIRGVIEDVADVREAMLRAEAERDGAYRERAQLLAWLATLHGPNAVLAPALDIDDENRWHLLFLTVAGRQMSWHIAPRDLELLTHVERVDVADPRAQWDGHTTEEKYQRIRTLPWGEMRDAVRTPGPADEALVRLLALLEQPWLAEPHSDGHDHVCPDDVRKAVLAALDEPKEK
ncbi:hypothetical protein ACFWFF_01450 [Streptomyces sp. NPDC060223]|uniref:hypothetical protein n=1 Tax=unclassified Streptomyces TaxID=2593676 RepID=UPI003629B76A